VAGLKSKTDCWSPDWHGPSVSANKSVLWGGAVAQEGTRAVTQRRETPVSQVGYFMAGPRGSSSYRGSSCRRAWQKEKENSKEIPLCRSVTLLAFRVKGILGKRDGGKERPGRAAKPEYSAQRDGQGRRVRKEVQARLLGDLNRWEDPRL